MEEFLFKVKNNYLILDVINSGLDMDLKQNKNNSILTLQLFYLDELNIWETSSNFKIFTMLESPKNDIELELYKDFFKDFILSYLTKEFEDTDIYSGFKKLEYLSKDWFENIPSYLKEEWCFSL